MKEYFKIIKLRLELSKSPLFFTISLLLSQVKSHLLNLYVLPTLSNFFWTVLDEPLYKGLSSNEFLQGRIRSTEFLRGRIRKESPFHFFFIIFLLSYFFCPSLFFLFSVCPFLVLSLDIFEGHNDYRGKGDSLFKVI